MVQFRQYLSPVPYGTTDKQLFTKIFSAIDRRMLSSRESKVARQEVSSVRQGICRFQLPEKVFLCSAVAIEYVVTELKSSTFIDLLKRTQQSMLQREHNHLCFI